MPTPIPPVHSHVDAYFWAGAAEGRLLVQRCAGCSLLIHPPQPMCQRCASVDRTTHEASPRGSVYSWLVSRHPSRPDDDPRIVALIDLEQGGDPFRLVSNLCDVEPSVVHPGLEVEVCFADFGGVTLPQFRPVAA